MNARPPSPAPDTTLHSGLMLLARLLLAPAFLYSGADKLVNWSAAELEVAASGLPFPTLLHIVTVAVQLGAGLSVLLGIQARIGALALALALFLIPVTVLYHPFWSVPADRLDEELNHFLSNTGLIGGFLMLVLFGAGRFSIEDRPLTAAAIAHLRRRTPALKSAGPEVDGDPPAFERGV